MGTTKRADLCAVPSWLARVGSGDVGRQAGEGGGKPCRRIQVAGGAPPSPILDCSPGVLAATHTDHEQGEEEEKGCRSKAHAVDSTVAEQRATVDVALQDHGGARHIRTHPGQLWGEREREQLNSPAPPGSLGLILPRPARTEALPVGAGPGQELEPPASTSIAIHLWG